MAMDTSPGDHVVFSYTSAVFSLLTCQLLNNGSISDIVYGLVHILLQDGYSPLIVVSQKGCTRVVEILLGAGANIKHQTEVWCKFC